MRFSWDYWVRADPSRHIFKYDGDNAVAPVYCTAVLSSDNFSEETYGYMNAVAVQSSMEKVARNRV